ncbi:MAG: 50S ribosomal protein L2 [Candidatus Nanoarchaeia archaeon]|nr:50S ribosomal protein L2 [Candidatus Nanoarchaeia archaeon]
MGKSLIQQARGRGSLTFRVRPIAYRYRISYPRLDSKGKGKIISLLNSPAHSAPLAKIQIEKEIFYVPAADGVYEGKEIMIDEKREGDKPENGDILRLKEIHVGANIFNIEVSPGSGGKFVRSSGCYGIILNKDENGVEVLINRRRLRLNENCRAIIGIVAGQGRTIKPLIKAGKRYHMMKAIGRKWHRTSAIKMNALDHPFGGGRGKRIKSKIAKRNAPAGAKVGHIRPRRTGWKRK